MGKKETLRERAAKVLDLTHRVGERGPRTLLARQRLATGLDAGRFIGGQRKALSDIKYLEQIAKKGNPLLGHFLAMGAVGGLASGTAFAVTQSYLRRRGKAFNPKKRKKMTLIEACEAYNRDEISMSKVAEAWWREQGKKVPRENTKAYEKMYEEYIEFAFAGFAKNPKEKTMSNPRATKKELREIKEIKSLLESAQSLWGFMSQDMSLSKAERMASKRAYKRAGRILRRLHKNPPTSRKTSPEDIQEALDLVAAGDWPEALELIWTSTPGITRDEAVQILKKAMKRKQPAKNPLPKSVSAFAIKHHIRLGRDVNGYFVRDIETGEIIERTAHAKATSSQAIAMMKRYLRRRELGIVKNPDFTDLISGL